MTDSLTTELFEIILPTELLQKQCLYLAKTAEKPGFDSAGVAFRMLLVTFDIQKPQWHSKIPENLGCF